jgi:hypothetical protein
MFGSEKEAQRCDGIKNLIPGISAHSGILRDERQTVVGSPLDIDHTRFLPSIRL